MANEFLRTHCTKYLRDELCHKKRSRVKELLRTLKGKPPRAKAWGRCPSVVPPPPYSKWWLMLLFFYSGRGHQTWAKMANMPSWSIVIHIYTHYSSSSWLVGIYAVWGLGPSRGSLLLSIPSTSLPPSRAVLYSLLEGGKGARTAQHSAALAGRSAGWPSLALSPKKTVVMIMVKGPWSHGPRAPLFNFALHVQCMQTTGKSGKASKAQPKQRMVDETKQRGQEVKARGFGVWMRAGHTHIQHSPSATAKNPKPSTSAKCIGTNSWDRMASIKLAKSSSSTQQPAKSRRLTQSMSEREVPT